VKAELRQAREPLLNGNLHVMAGDTFMVGERFVAEQFSMVEIGGSNDDASRPSAIRRTENIVRGIAGLRSGCGFDRKPPRFEQFPDPKPGENEVIVHVRAAALKPVARYGRIAGPVDPLWSISVEEQFYILIPLIVASGRRAALAIAGGVFLLTAYAAVWLYAHHPSIGDNGAWTNSFVQFQFFAAGTLIALALRGRLPRFPIHRRIIGVALAICCWFSHSLS
jgi:hypothetical protein